MELTRHASENSPPTGRLRNRSSLHLAVLSLAIASAPVSHADLILIDPFTGVTASSEIGAPFDRQDDFIVDGSGLFAGEHTAAVESNMWLSSGTDFGGDDPDPSVLFDLGEVYTITSFHVWNYNEAPPDLTSRGVNEVSVEFGTTEALGSTVPGITNFTQADGLETYTGEKFDAFPPFTARFIKFVIKSNHGGDNNFYGLSEVEFDGTLSGLAVSPSSFVTSATQGDKVGTLSTPSGAAGDTFTYSLIAGAGDTDNSKFQIVGDVLQIGPHDFSAATDGQAYTFRVQSTGAPSGQQIEASLSVTASADSDADGLLDVWELRWAGAGNLAVLSGLGGGNADGDTLTDLEEFNLRLQFPNLNPTLADSDGDDLDDGDEIAGAGQRPPTNPTDADTDGDTLTDTVESNTGLFVDLTDTGSNPTLADTDADSFTDGAEVTSGSNPNDPNSTPPVELVGYWPFDATADPQPDLSGFANDASVAAGATWVNDAERGGVMEFDGNDSYLEAADSESLSVTGDITIAAWVNITDFTNWRGIVGKSAGPAGNLPASYDLYFVLDDGRARLYSGSPDGFGQVTATTIPAVGEWHHVAVTRIGDQVSFYYDGQLDGQGVTAQPMLDSDAALRIGNRTDLVTDFLGRMDDVAIFAGGLSPGQIADIMDGDFSGFGVSGTGNTFPLTIARNGSDLDLTWQSQAGMLYNLLRSDDLSTWTLVEGNIPATPDINTKTISPADPARFYRVEEFPPPPVTVFAENFDSAPNLPDGWTTGAGTTDTGSTQWQLGNPAGGPGPPAASSGANCVGTNIDAKYGTTSDTWLRSPASIDLTTATSAKLVFQQWVDMDNFDFGDIGTVRVLDAADLPATVTELAVLRTNIQGLDPAGWSQFSKTLPPSALGKSIVLEFRFSSDSVDVGDASGWYIDDIVVTAQVP